MRPSSYKLRPPQTLLRFPTRSSTASQKTAFSHGLGGKRPWAKPVARSGVHVKRTLRIAVVDVALVAASAEGAHALA